MTVWESFYSRNLYQRVQRWRGRALLYLGGVLCLCWTPLFIRFHILAGQVAGRVALQASAQLPVIRYENGHISTPENRPYLFHFGEGLQKVEMIVDASGKYTSLEGQSAQLLVTRDKIFTRQKSGEMRMYDISKGKMRSFVIDQDFIQKIFTLFRRWALPVIYLFIFFLSYMKRLVQAFLMALCGLAVAYVLESDLDLGELFSLAIVAMTPAMILQTLANVSGKSFRFEWLLWGLMIISYYIFAMNAAADKTESAANPVE